VPAKIVVDAQRGHGTVIFLSVFILPAYDHISMLNA